MARADEAELKVESLLQKGLDLYGQNRVPEAIACWQRVLELDPDELRARDYLETAGDEAKLNVHAAPRPDSKVIDLHAAREHLSHTVYDSNRERRVDGRQIVELIESKRYEEALTLLYIARKQAPQDPSVSRSIKLVKDRLTLKYVKRVGSLDQVPAVVASESTLRGLKLDVDERELVDLIDGIASVGDIVECSRLGRFKTYRGFARFLDMGVIALKSGEGLDETLSRALTPSQIDVRGAVQPAATTPPAPPRERKSSPDAESPEKTETEEPPEPYVDLFNRATRAYLKRDYCGARELFQQCLEMRPDDQRVRHNLQKLEQ